MALGHQLTEAGSELPRHDYSDVVYSLLLTLTLAPGLKSSLGQEFPKTSSYSSKMWSCSRALEQAAAFSTGSEILFTHPGIGNYITCRSHLSLSVGIYSSFHPLIACRSGCAEGD